MPHEQAAGSGVHHPDGPFHTAGTTAAPTPSATPVAPAPSLPRPRPLRKSGPCPSRLFVAAAIIGAAIGCVYNGTQKAASMASTASVPSKIARRVAVVTGGNKGIGYEIVKKLAFQKDVQTILTARSIERGESSVKTLKKEGLEVDFAPLDLNDKKSITKFAEWMQKKYGKFDILVNNAAIAFKGSDPTPFKDQADPTLKTNFWGTMNVCDTLIPFLNDGGCIVNVASQSGTSAFSKLSGEMKKKFKDPGLDRQKLEGLANKFSEDVKAGKHTEEGWANSCYGTSKLLVIFYTQLLAKQLESRRIVSNSMCPGYCATDMSSHRGHRSPAQGADTAVWLALQSGKDRPNGGFYFDRKIIDI